MPAILSANKKIYIDKPIILLISQKCFSATELFLAPFKVTKRGTLIGTRTAGGSANPLMEKFLSEGKVYEVRIPTWRFFLEGETQPLEETAIEPDITYFGEDILEFSKKVASKL